MALQKQIIPISYGEGIDTKPDKKQQLPGKLRRAVNVVFETLFSAKKRNGYDSILLYTTTGTKLTEAQALASYNKELVVFDKTNLYSFSDSLQKLQQKGPIYNIFPFSTPVLNNSYNHDSLDVISVENLNVHVYHNTITNDVRYSVQDLSTKSLLISDDIVATSSQTVQVGSINNVVYIVYTTGTTLHYKSFNILNPSVLSSAVLLASDVDATAPKLDIISSPSKIVVAYNSTQGGSKLHVLSILSSGIATSTVGVATADPSQALDVVMDSSSRIIISYSNGTNVSYVIFPFNLIAILTSVTVIETVAGVKNVSCIETSNGNYTFYYEVAATDAVNYYIKKNTGTRTGTVGSASVYMRSVGLASKVFKHNNISYIPLALETTLQSTYFIADSAGTVVSKWSGGTGGGHITTGVLPQTIMIADDQYLITSQIKNKSVSENGTFYGLLGINSTTIDFAFANPYQNAFLGDNLHIAGGLLQMYDGDSVVEHGFNYYPEQLATTLQDAALIGNIGAGDYGYKAVYRWTDNAGQDHFSAPSLDFNVLFTTSIAAFGTLAVVAPVVVTSAIDGFYKNGNTLTVTVAAAAANPTNTILAVVSGTSAATVLTITPNNGTNNTLVPVTLTTTELAQLITGGAVTGKTVTLTDTNKLLDEYNATGGSTANIVAGTTIATLQNGAGIASHGSLATTVPIIVYERAIGPATNGTKFTLQILAAAANPTNTVLASFTGTAAAIVLTITPNDGTNNGLVPVNLTTAEVAQLISTGIVAGKTVTVTDASTLRPAIRASGGGPQIVVDGGEGDGKATSLDGGLLLSTNKVVVPTLRITAKQNVVIELYRTENNGNIYYLTSSVVAPTFNNKTTDTVTITDSTVDAELISHQTLYTTGGVLENIAAPAITTMSTHTASNRIIIANKNANEVQFSKIREKGKPVEFNDDLVKPINPSYGEITGLSEMDDKALIFTENGIQYFSGVGPNNLGQQDLFTDVELLSRDTGCTDPRSIIFTPKGVFFKSKKGIFLLNRSLQLEYIGAPVEEFNALTITSAKVVADFNQVRFTTSDGETLVYNYNIDLWGTFDNHMALSAEIVNDQYYYLRTSSQLFKENPTVYGDNGVPIRLLLETGWMTMMQLQGYQRAYQVLVLGEYKSAHKLRIRAAYNFNEAYVQEKIIDPSQLFIDSTPYGGYSPYGEPPEIPFGGFGNVYQARFDLERQKCQALKLLIEDEQSSAGEGVSLSAMTILVGGKGGLFKVDNNRKFGLE